jgi:uncharacterized membrane protein YgcG
MIVIDTTAPVYLQFRRIAVYSNGELLWYIADDGTLTKVDTVKGDPMPQHVFDTTSKISKSDVLAIDALADKLPFTLNVIVGEYPTRANLDNAVHECITSPTMVCIGVDPAHRYTFTHFGAGTGVPASSFQAVAAAGNPLFRSGDWAGGVTAIAQSAAGSRVSTQAPGVVLHTTETVTRTEPMGAGWWGLIGILAICAVFGGVVAWLSRRNVKKIDNDMQRFREETDALQSRNIEEQGWHDKMAAKMGPKKEAYIPRLTHNDPAPRAARAKMIARNQAASGTRPPTTHVHVSAPASSGNDLLTGVLIGEALAPHNTYVEPRREREPEPAPFHSSSDGDSGAGSSYSPSPSYDSGSSYDGGSSGGDFGGGGSDSGGGGGDF